MISERIRKAIEETHLSYGELSKLTKIPKSALHRYATGETGKCPIERIEAIASATGVPASYLLGWEDTPSSDESLALIPTENTIHITRRTGVKSQYTLSDEQVDIVERMIKQMPSAPLYGEIAAQGAKLNRAYDIEDEITKKQKKCPHVRTKNS